MTIIMLPDYRPDKFAENITKYKPNHVAAGPADWSSFLKYKRNHNLSYLKIPGSGSDSLSIKNKVEINKVLQRMGCKEKVYEGYGMTEVGSAACTNLPQCDVLGSVGIPLPLNMFCIYDSETESELSYEEKGEICITGPTLMKGYYNNPEETDKVIRIHKDGIKWLHTGDVGYMTKDGCVFLDGRLKRIIVRYDGQKVSPFDVEKVIMNCDEVTACCVVGVFDKEHQSGQVPVAYVSTKSENEKIVINEVMKKCRNELPEKCIPKKVCVLEKLPLTPNGKVDYRALERAD